MMSTPLLICAQIQEKIGSLIAHTSTQKQRPNRTKELIDHVPINTIETIKQ